MNTTATHDTKRGEDARARISALSEMPRVWEQRLRAWSRVNRRLKGRRGRVEVPDANDEYLLYQSLLGSYPANGTHDDAFIERLQAFLIKAVREAKVHTEWLKPDDRYEKGFVDFAAEILRPGEHNRFLPEFVPFARSIAHCGMFNSLSQTLLKLAAPGVPDIYQGTEDWDLSFVDPDNRRPVDFTERRRCLAAINAAESNDPAGLLRDLLAGWPDGRIKLFVMHKLLHFRGDHPELFSEGTYLPLGASGRLAERICAFARSSDGLWAAAVAPRLIGAAVYHGEAPLGDFWNDSAVVLPQGAPRRWRDLLSGNEIEAGADNFLPLTEVFRSFPVSLLVHDGRDSERSATEEQAHATVSQPIA